jgi:hypothetical protein
MAFVGFSDEESYDLSLEIEPRLRANSAASTSSHSSTSEKIDGYDTLKGDTPKGDTVKGKRGSKLKISVITTFESVRSHGPPTPPSLSSKPPQEMLTLTNRLVKKKWVCKKV